MSQENRVETMAAKLAVSAERAGVAHDALSAAYQRSMQPRLAAFSDVFHPDMLHPARTVLILLADCEVRDAELLTAAALTESEYPDLRVPGEEVRAQFGVTVAGLREAVPLPDDEELTEKLVTAPHDVAMIALAERLDHARHLKFRNASVWRPFFTQIEAVYLPVAQRVSDPLARRFERWAKAFAKQQLKAA